jgi:predicted secreted protein
MQWTSILAIYALLWVLSAFLVMPFGLRTPDEIDGHVIEQGHADSAPVNFSPGKVAVRATILGAVLMGLFYANYLYGWIEVGSLNFFGKPPEVNVGY